MLFLLRTILNKNLGKKGNYALLNIYQCLFYTFTINFLIFILLLCSFFTVLTNIPTLKMSDRPNTSQQQMKRKLEDEKLADLEEVKMDAKKAKMMKEIAELMKKQDIKLLEAIRAMLMGQQV